MKNTLPRHAAIFALSIAAALPLAAEAHRAWMLPSATVLSGNEPWLTVDAASSNDLFYFEHQPMRLDGVEVIAPDGTQAKIENQSTGRYRSTFDVKLIQKGTYKVSRVMENITASYTLNGELKRFRGSSAAFAKEVPAEAQDLRVSKNHGRLEVFVTSGNPTDKVLQPSGAGLELAPITHPNDLFVGEKASFRLLLNGKPQAGIEVTLIPGGIRYRNQLGEIKAVTDQDGKFSVEWKEPGMYWMNATASEGAAAGRTQGGPPPGGAPGAGGPPAGGPQGGGAMQAANNTPVTPGQRASYTATLEVLPQ